MMCARHVFRSVQKAIQTDRFYLSYCKPTNESWNTFTWRHNQIIFQMVDGCYVYRVLTPYLDAISTRSGIEFKRGKVTDLENVLFELSHLT